MKCFFSFKKSKFIIGIVMIFTMLFSLFWANTALVKAETLTGNLGVTGSETSVTYSYNTETKELTISGTGEIIDNAISVFNNAGFGSEMVSVVVGEGITKIGTKFLNECPKVKNVSLPSTLTNLGYYAFANDTNLRTVKMDCQITEIPTYCFYKCESLQSIAIPKTVTKIGYEAFGRVGLTKIVIPENVYTIDQYAFENSVKLKYLTFLNKVTYLFDSSFTNVKASISLPSNWEKSDFENKTSFSTYTYHDHNFVERTIKEASTKDKGLKESTCVCGYCYQEEIEKYPSYKIDEEDGYIYIYEEVITKNFVNDIYVYMLEADLFDGFPCHIYLGPSVKEVKDEAFTPLGNVGLIIFGKNVDKIGTELFYGSSKVGHVTFQGLPTTIAENAINSKSSNVCYYLSTDWKDSDIAKLGDYTSGNYSIHEHNYSENILWEATHFESGMAYYSCDECFMEYYEEISKLPDHTYGEANYTWNNNVCTAEKECNCGAIEKEESTATYVKDTDATCTANEKGHYTVSFTNTAFESQTTAANSVDVANSMLTHTYGDWYKVDDYTHKHKCSCGAYETASHTYGEVNYTWYKTACIAERTCTCGAKEREETTIKYVKDTDATCTADETGHYTASFKNAAFGTQTTATNSAVVEYTMLPHTYGDWYKIDTNIHRHECSCGAYEIAPHTFGTPQYTWDNEVCTAERVCACGEKQTQESTATYVKDTAATCTTNETGHYTVSFTNTAFATQNTTANSVVVENTMIPHTYGEWIKVDDSTHKHECSCGTFETENHNITSEVTLASTHTTLGEKTYTCSICNYSYKEDVPMTEAHEYGEPTYTWNNNVCTAERLCACGAKETEEETATYVKDTEATCTTNETGHYTVSFTNTAFATQNTTANSVVVENTKLPHTYGEWIKVDDLTHKHECSCGAFETENHNITSEVTLASTHTTLGEKTYTCSICNYSYKEDIPMTEAHEYGEPTYTWNKATCIAKVTCACGDVVTEAVTAKYEVVNDSTITAVGEGKYSVEFTSTLFTSQAKKVEIAKKQASLTNGDVKLEAEKGFAANVTLEAKVSTNVDSANYANFLEDNEVVIAIVSVTLYKEVDGKMRELAEEELSSGITLKIKLPENSTNIVIKHLHSNSYDVITYGEKAGIGTYVIEDGYAVTVINSLSDFAIVQTVNTGLSGGAIAGIVIGVIALLGLAAGVSFFIIKRRLDQAQE